MEILNMDKDRCRKINDQCKFHGFYKSKCKLLWEPERKRPNSEMEGVANAS